MSVVVPVNPDVLLWARTSVGVSRFEAAAKIGVEPEVLEGWETGQDKPTIGPLRELADLYRRPLAAFLLPRRPKDPPAPADFRVMKGGSQQLLSADTRYAINRAFELRALAASLEAPVANPSAIVEGGLSRRTPPAKAAVEERERLGISFDEQRAWKNTNQALNRWRRALERRGVLVFTLRMPLKEVRGFSISGPGGPPVIVLNPADTEAGRIFTLIHEYGHVLLGTGGICLPSTWPFRASAAELYCNRFAGALLVPLEDLRSQQDIMAFGTSSAIPDERAVAAAAAVFSVSKQVLWYRLRDTGVISKGRFAAKWPLWSSQKPKKKAKQKGGPTTPIRVLAARGMRFTGLVLAANNERTLTTNEALDYLGIRLDDLEAVEHELRRRSVA
jgi:Zn-dependent peptidase ImmA (M78 family)